MNEDVAAYHPDNRPKLCMGFPRYGIYLKIATTVEFVLKFLVYQTVFY